MQCAAHDAESSFIRPYSRNYGELVELEIGVLMWRKPLVDSFHGDPSVFQCGVVQRTSPSHLRQFLSLAFREPAGTDGLDAQADRY